ncbi:MAG: hypothetical protein ACJAS1_001981 [Oleiphilaceae bacterium]|jgi:hypothetical protein
MKEKQVFDFAARDQRRWEVLNELCESNDLGIEQVLKNFPAFVRRRELPRFLAHYELFKHTIDLPGCICELGVSMGVSLITWANLMETFCPGDRTRKVYGFDHFKGLQDFKEKDGIIPEGNKVGKDVGGWSAPEEIAKTLVELFNEDTIPPNISRVEIVDGDIFDTLPIFLEQNPGFKVSLLHLDVDLYEVSKFALEQLFDLVCVGGVICFDEYGLVPWQGETLAVDEFFKARGMSVRLEKFPFSATPSGYFIKK